MCEGLLDQEQYQKLMHHIAKEVLEERLGIPASENNIKRFISYIAQFEHEIGITENVITNPLKAQAAGCEAIFSKKK